VGKFTGAFYALLRCYDESQVAAKTAALIDAAAAAGDFIGGGAGQDSFFVDGRATAENTTWSTITDFSPGEHLTLWGYQPGVSTMQWVESAGAEGYTGATLHCDLDGNGVIDTSITFTGLPQEQVPTPIYGADCILFG
jgi:hypothetical protein